MIEAPSVKPSTKSRRGDWFQTFTGRQFWPMDPSPEDISIIDIGHGLGNTCRFGGHVNHFYSVAQHSLFVSNHCRQYPLIGLLHDATEAYLGDMVRPLKCSMPLYKHAEERLWKVIAEHFGLPFDMPHCVKEADNLALVTERRDLMGRCPARWAEELEAITPANEHITPLPPEHATRQFLGRFLDLT